MATDWSKVREGDFVHFSRFQMNYEQKDVWGICILESRSGEPHFDIICGVNDNDLLDMENWPAYAADRGTVVPEAEIPDFVWAALAKRRLTE